MQKKSLYAMAFAMTVSYPGLAKSNKTTDAPQNTTKDALQDVNITPPSEARAVPLCFANMDYIISVLPAMKQVKADLEIAQKQLQNDLKTKSEEVQSKYTAFQKAQMAMTPEVRDQKQKALEQLVQAFQIEEQTANETMRQKQEELMVPVYTQVNQAIHRVGQTLGCNILNAHSNGVNIVLYMDDSANVTPQILEALNIKPEDILATTSTEPTDSKKNTQNTKNNKSKPTGKKK